MKKKMLGASEAWSMSRSSQQPRDPAYYIEHCRVLDETHLIATKLTLSFHHLSWKYRQLSLLSSFFAKKRRKVNPIWQQPKTCLFEGCYKLNRLNIT